MWQRGASQWKLPSFWRNTLIAWCDRGSFFEQAEPADHGTGCIITKRVAPAPNGDSLLSILRFLGHKSVAATEKHLLPSSRLMDESVDKAGKLLQNEQEAVADARKDSSTGMAFRLSSDSFGTSLLRKREGIFRWACRR
jgi:hypothetical protein